MLSSAPKKLNETTKTRIANSQSPDSCAQQIESTMRWEFDRCNFNGFVDCWNLFSFYLLFIFGFLRNVQTADYLFIVQRILLQFLNAASHHRMNTVEQSHSFSQSRFYLLDFVIRLLILFGFFSLLSQKNTFPSATDSFSGDVIDDLKIKNECAFFPILIALLRSNCVSH